MIEENHFLSEKKMISAVSLAKNYNYRRNLQLNNNTNNACQNNIKSDVSFTSNASNSSFVKGALKVIRHIPTALGMTIAGASAAATSVAGITGGGLVASTIEKGIHSPISHNLLRIPDILLESHNLNEAEMGVTLLGLAAFLTNGVLIPAYREFFSKKS